MTPNPQAQERIRRYLLGQLTDGARQEIEQDLLTNQELFEELLVVEDELIDEYLGGKLGPKERASFESHFLATSERHEKLRFGRAFDKYLSSQAATSTVREFRPLRGQWAWTQTFLSPPLRIAACAILVLGIAVGIWAVFFRQSEIDKGLVALNAAYREQRPLEARISSLSYAPFSQTRGPGTERVNENDLRRAELTLLDALNKKPTPAVHHALGEVYLAKKQFDEAIREFEEALKSDPRNAQLLSDLGAAWLEKGKIDRNGSEPGKGMEELGRSLENLNKALELTPNPLEAIFNRALCHQYLMLPHQAQDDWRAYLEKDSTSPWAEEARRNLKVLQEQQTKTSLTKEGLLRDFLSAFQNRDDEAAWGIISQNRDLSGNPIENLLIDEYLNLETNGHWDEGRKKREVLSYAADLEIRKASDPFISDLMAFYEAKSAAQLILLADARRLLKSGHENLQQSKPEEAVENYTKAKQIFDQTGDECEAIYVQYPLGHSYLLQSKSELSLSAFKEVVRGSQSHQYKWLLAQALNATANVRIGLNDYSAALDASERSLEISRLIGDTTGVIKTTDQLAQEYFYLGNYHKSLSLHQQSLDLAIRYATEPLQIWRNYFTIAMPFSALGLSAAAVEFEKEALGRAVELKMPQIICRSYVILGLMYGGQHNYEEATRNVELALKLGQGLSSKTAQMETIAYSSLQLGHLYRQTRDFNRAIANYDRAIQTYRELNFQAFDYVAHKGKLLACIEQGGCPSAEQEIEIALGLFEHARAKILHEANRDSFFDTEQNIYDVAIDFEHSNKNDDDTAFEYSELSRARSLLDLTTTDSSVSDDNTEPDIRFGSVKPPMSLAALQARLPEQTQVVQYAVLDNKLLIWLVSRADHACFEQNITRDELNNRVLQYLHKVSSPAENSDQELLEAVGLYDILIRPVESALDKRKQVCVVPDKILNYLPFGALFSPLSGKYLVQEYALTVAPSSNMFVVCSGEAEKKVGTKRERLLSVGNPSFDRQTFPTLGDLPSAAREATEIASYYPPSQPILGKRATKSLVESELPKSEVVHLALHYLMDEVSPMRSKLLLANQSGPGATSIRSDGVLQAYEIYQLNFPVTRLVVLSACQTGIERYYGGEGMIGIARPFIARGVPLVVASLWPVDSDSTTDLMISFHRHRKNGSPSTVEALRQAQLEMITGPNKRFRNAYYWASFTAIGGYARF